MVEYAELHCHSNFSFQEGASSIEELVLRAKDLHYSALALTDHDNLCGAMEFSKEALSLDVKGVIGSEVTLENGDHVTLLVMSSKGYSNLCRLLSYSRVLKKHCRPELNPSLLADHAEGLILLTGCAKGTVPRLLQKERIDEAKIVARQYQEWFGVQNVYLELQQNLVYGDTQRIKRLVQIGADLKMLPVATNNVHYHSRERHRLQDCLVAIKACKSLEETHHQRRANAEFHMKTPNEMAYLFNELPQAIFNTLVIAERCNFVLPRDITYRFPEYPINDNGAPIKHLEKICREAALRRYGVIKVSVEDRLREELHLIEKYNLAGFLLIYRDIIQMAHEIQIELGLVDSELPVEESPPGRGRGSSVAMLVGYLIGLSHIDPLQYALSLERFLPDQDLLHVPDIDLDFPRNIREELIKRVHKKYGWDHAALTGAISTYRSRGVVRDLGKALGLPLSEVGKLAKQVESESAKYLRDEMLALSDFRFRVNAPGWRELIDLASQLDGFPKHLGQHPGGMIISSTPLIDQVPVQPGAIEGRYICQWDKDSIDDARFVKIDFLALGALSQMQRVLKLIEKRTGRSCDLSRIDFADESVYGMLHRADTIGIFQVESAAQMQVITRIRPCNLVDMAHQVAAVRPGVGVNAGVNRYIHRRNGVEPVEFDHELERRALERTLGIILFQDQVNQVATDVGGLSMLEADQMRRAFSKGNRTLLGNYWEKFREGALAQNVSLTTAKRIFKKFNGHYMFPESHAYAFGITAYQMAWLKYHYPLEFFVGLFNEQPMGFYNLETLKEDAKRHGISILSPDINQSLEESVMEGEAIRLGFLNIQDIGSTVSANIVQERLAHGAFKSVADFMERTRVVRKILENLIDVGAFDNQHEDRRAVRWEIGLRYRLVGTQSVLAFPIEQDVVALPHLTPWEEMEEEYRSMRVHPSSHVMAYLRPYLTDGLLNSQELLLEDEGARVQVAGMIIRRQHPVQGAYFLTLEDELGHIPLIVWEKTYRTIKDVLSAPFIRARGVLSRREGTLNVIVSDALPLEIFSPETGAKNWT